MDKMKKKIPALRFPGFEGEWVGKRLGEVLLLKSRPLKMEDEKEYPLVTVKRQYGGVVFRGTFRGEEIKVKSQFVLKENDFLISKRQICHNACGIVHREFENSIVSNEYSVFIPQSDLNILYFNYFCRLPKVSHSFYLSSIGVHIEKMLFKVEDWLKWKFPFPTLAEQQKIADFLTSVDDKINQFTRKKTLLEQYKKGVMQKIFAKEIRFKDDDGNDFPEWKVKRLEEVISNFIVPMRDKPKDLTGNIPWCRIEDFQGKYLSNSKSGQGVTHETIKEMNLKVFPINTLIVSCSANLGFCAIVKNELITNQTFIGLVPNESRVDVNFLYYTMKLSARMLNTLSSGTTISYLSRAQFEKFKIPFPSLPEQQKIADFLTGIDKKIELIDTQLEKTKEWKKGLLQQMFV